MGDGALKPGTILGVWVVQTPSPGDTSCIDSLEREWMVHSVMARGTVIAGDLNVHSIRWLRHSNAETPEGRRMAEVCRVHGLRQAVRGPTRGEHLLDLVLSDIPGVTATTTAAVADHMGVLAVVPFSVPEVAAHQRTLWDFRRADWEQLQARLSETDWSFISRCQPDDGSAGVTERILDAAADCIPKREATVRRSTHPWLTKKAMDAIASKHRAQGQPDEQTAAVECSSILLAEFNAYAGQTRNELVKLKQGSKLWWTKARELLQEKARTSSIPALKVNGEWVMDAEGKTNAFVDTFAAKNIMIEKKADEFSNISTLVQCRRD